MSDHKATHAPLGSYQPCRNSTGRSRLQGATPSLGCSTCCRCCPHGIHMNIQTPACRVAVAETMPSALQAITQHNPGRHGGGVTQCRGLWQVISRRGAPVLQSPEPCRPYTALTTLQLLNGSGRCKSVHSQRLQHCVTQPVPTHPGGAGHNQGAAPFHKHTARHVAPSRYSVHLQAPQPAPHAHSAWQAAQQ